MPAKSDPINPTEPGPFQKYLFSGACYVQVGECYGLIKQAMRAHEAELPDEALCARLKQIWQTTITQQFMPLLAMASDPRFSAPDDQVPPIAQIEQLVTQSGNTFIDELLPILSASQPSSFELADFFRAWSKASDRAYANLVASDTFSSLLGNSVNTLLDLAKPSPNPQ